MFKIIFAIALMSAQGPQFANLDDPAKFQTKEECVEFGTQMSPRVADWVRGRIQAYWDVPVSVQYTCEVDGNPA